MSFSVVLFTILASVTACSALGVVLARSVVHAAVWLLFTLIGVSMLYFLLGAEFLGAAQLIVYVGGTLVLVVFGVMLTSQGPFQWLRTKPMEWAVGGTLAVAMFAVLVKVSLGLAGSHPPVAENVLPGPGALGLTFLGVSEKPGGGAFLLAFEIVSVHLLVVLVAAAYLARAKRKPTEVPRD